MVITFQCGPRSLAGCLHYPQYQPFPSTHSTTTAWGRKLRLSSRTKIATWLPLTLIALFPQVCFPSFNSEQKKKCFTNNKIFFYRLQTKQCRLCVIHTLYNSFKILLFQLEIFGGGFSSRLWNTHTHVPLHTRISTVHPYHLSVSIHLERRKEKNCSVHFILETWKVYSFKLGFPLDFFPHLSPYT